MPPKRRRQSGGKGLRNTWSSSNSDNSKSSSSKALRSGKKIKNGKLHINQLHNVLIQKQFFNLSKLINIKPYSKRIHYLKS